MAVGFLGARRSRSGGFRGAGAVLLGEPIEAWVGRAGGGLAVFVDPPGCAVVPGRAGVGGRFEASVVQGVGRIKPTCSWSG